MCKCHRLAKTYFHPWIKDVEIFDLPVSRCKGKQAHRERLVEAGIGCPSGTFGAGTTNYIEVILLFSDEFLKTMDCIVAALREKGYDPYKQLYAYVTENDLEYITRHN